MTTFAQTGSLPEPSLDPFSALMARVQCGDEASFADLYDLTQVHLGRVIGRVLRAPDQSVEVLQEVYFYAWQHARCFDPDRGTVLGWLTVLARRRAIDRIRSVTRSVARDQRHLYLEDAVVPDVADLGIARREAARLRDAVRQLRTKQREAVTLTYLGGYTHEEAAALLGVPLGTLKTRVRAGIGNLRTHFEALPA